MDRPNVHERKQRAVGDTARTNRPHTINRVKRVPFHYILLQFPCLRSQCFEIREVEPLAVHDTKYREGILDLVYRIKLSGTATPQKRT